LSALQEQNALLQKEGAFFEKNVLLFCRSSDVLGE